MQEEVYSDGYGRIEYEGATGCLELIWLDTTEDMSDGEFRSWLLTFARYGEELNPTFMLIDGRQFKHQMSSEVGAWREEVIISRYNNAGVKKLAFLLPTGIAPVAEPHPEPGADFPTGYFDSRGEIDAWFAS